MESGAPFALTQAGKQQQQQRLRMQPLLLEASLPQPGASLPLSSPLEKKTVRNLERAVPLRPRLYSLISSVRAFSRRQHNLQ